RARSINPEIQVEVRPCFYLPENADTFDFADYDYAVDAVDTVTAKLEIISRAKENNVPVISSMGAGNKLDPTKFQVADISKTSICPLAKVMRRECKKRGLKHIKVVYSTEEALTPGQDKSGEPSSRRSTPGSVAFVPSVAGLIIAGEVVKDLAEVAG
ncbi:MAG: tRNA threonylcarbamoyladenosine dehydratase, partial [Lachnospiraceae bacterium]|nr:tRNA threonylcarbamoyladenosine dehydratase [Candidatus Equihabitans merdae]